MCEPNTQTINYGRYKLVNLGDFHTHTVFSLHGMSSPSEMVTAAKNVGLKYLAITDHHTPFCLTEGYPNYEDPMFYHINNQEARMWEYKRSFSKDNTGINVIPGYEYNLFVTEERCKIDYPHLRIIGAHSWHFYGRETRKSEIEEEIYNKLKSGKYSFLTHPERGIETLGKDLNPEFEKDKDSLMRAIPRICKELDIPIELNVSSLTSSDKRYTEMINIWLLGAMQFSDVYVIVNSDAHVIYDVGRCEEGFKFLSDIHFPPERIINFSDCLIQKYIRKI